MKTASEIQEIFERHLVELLAQERFRTPLFQPMTYMLSLKAKRIRPLLLLLSWQAVSRKDISRALTLSAAVELFHNFTLVHDDIMDNAPVRRGMQTVQEKWNVNTAILSGDGMFALSLEWLVRDFPEKAAELVQEFSEMATGVCEGQSEDMQIEGKLQTGIPVYLEMIRKKTALLIGSSMKLGAIAAGANPGQCEAFYRWGEAAGLGFQMRDDYLDAFGAGEQVGKQTGGDILQNKMTYLVLKAREKADAAQASRLNQLLFTVQNPAEKVSGVLQLFAELGIQAETEKAMNEYFSIADECGRKLGELPGSAEITRLFELLKTRQN